ncbi:MAG: prepilin peptidase [Thiotrichaceae bacterium]|nr:prepilin peptidase [Thiotrichaceae bacterium]
MEAIEFLKQSPVTLFIVVTFFGLTVGSFLNVVIYRLPVMLEREWREQCNELQEDDKKKEDNTNKDKFNLAVPRSRCPHCNHLITALENIPIISYLLMRGKCSGCQQAISIRYPLVELMTGLLSVLVAWKFGASLQTLAALFFIWTLISLALIDLDTMYLPDSLTLPLLWLGIVVNYFGVFISLEDSIMGAIVGYLSLWTVFQLFLLLTGKEGFGFGDFKLLAALGAWGGWQIILPTIFAASLLGAIIGIAMMVVKKDFTSRAIPFGPWLAIAGGASFIWQDEIKQYLHYLLNPL